MTKALRYIETEAEPFAKYLDIMEDIDRNIHEFMSKQAVSGRSGLVGFETNNPGMDYAETVISPGPFVGTFVNLLLTFVGDGSQESPFVNPFIELYANGSKISLDDGYWTDGPNAVSVGTVLAFDKPTLESPYTRRWNTNVVVYGGVVLAADCRIIGTTRGTLGLVRTA